MNAPDPSVVDKVNSLGYQRLTLESQLLEVQNELKAETNAVKERFAPRLEAIAKQIREVDGQLFAAVKANESTLIGKGKRSFSTVHAKFQLRTVPASVEVLDKQGVMDVARKLGLVKRVATPPSGKWSFNLVKFRDWFKHAGKLREAFEPFVEYTDEGEALLLQPNIGHDVWHDGDRISPPSVTIKKS